ncbi:hypothetical protein [Phenylobacterium sp.]|jgi:uncharacterized membrane protein|uniref:hypothetical protein n=1 Tax=Phenylobacterium sp. TaxID=1871053 RepID=UPI002F407552
MTHAMDVNRPSAGHYEPEMVHQLLRRCAHCHAPHPLARRPPSPAGVCPDCGETAQLPGLEISVRAVLTGRSPTTLIARLFLWLGKALMTLAKGY